MSASVQSVSDRAHMQAAACRRLWCAVVLATLNDSWHAIRKKNANIPAIRAEALRYFRSRDGKTVLALAGITADPERLADAAVNPEARDRIKQLPGLRDVA